MKVAVIGCGTIANAAHIPSYMKNPEAEIKYFCDIIPERAQAAVEKYGCGTAVVDYHDVLADPEVEAVSVCTPKQRPSHHHHGRSPGREERAVRKARRPHLRGGAGDAEGPA